MRADSLISQYILSAKYFALYCKKRGKKLGYEHNLIRKNQNTEIENKEKNFSVNRTPTQRTAKKVGIKKNFILTQD